MRKALLIIGIIAVVLSIGGVGAYYINNYKNAPERLIIGKWESSINSYEFMEEGNVKIGTSLNISANGEYSINAEKKIISITYTALGLSYTNNFKFEFGPKNNTLTLTDTNYEKVSQAFSRVIEE